DATVEPSATARSGASWRCARCGIESPERTCFVIPRGYSVPPQDARCMTCERMAAARMLPWRYFRNQMSLWFLVIVLGSAAHLTVSEILRAVLTMLLLSPLALVVHELGHLVSARLCGVEVGGVGIGIGRKLWAGSIFGVPVRILAWPLSGRVYVGGF